MHKTTSTDDKRLQNTLKRLGVNTIPGIEEVHIFKDQSVIHFTNPKGAARPHPARRPHRRRAAARCVAVQASIAANTYVVSGPSQTKSACPNPGTPKNAPPRLQPWGLQQQPASPQPARRSRPGAGQAHTRPTPRRLAPPPRPQRSRTSCQA